MRAAGITAYLIVGLAVRAPDIAAADSAATGPCSLAGGRDVTGNTVTCNFGLTPEQLKQATEAAVSGATTPLAAQIRAIGKTLDVTEAAAKTLLRIVGEQPDVPTERLPEVLTKVAINYKRLQDQAAALNSESPTAARLVADAKIAISIGQFGRAHTLLRQATQAQIAEAQEAHKAEDARMLGAASSTAIEGELALTEQHYAEEADLFAAAAEYVPASHSGQRLAYQTRQAHARYEADIADFQERFRKRGMESAFSYAPLKPIEVGLQSLANGSTGGLRARALLDLGRVQRMRNDFKTAIGTLTEAAGLANAAALPDTEFAAWMNIARAHVIGTRDFGAAADAITRAEAIAGQNPTQRQQFDLGDMRSILYESRGDAEAALIQAIPLERLATLPSDRYFARRDIADALHTIFDRCQYEALTDANSSNDADPRWGACNRAMLATREAVNKTGAVAAELGWPYLALQAQEEARAIEFLFSLWHDHWVQSLSTLPAQRGAKRGPVVYCFL